MSYLQHIDSLMPPSGRGPLPKSGEPAPDHREWLRLAKLAPVSSVRLTQFAGRSTSPDTPLLAASAIVKACAAPLESTLVHTIAERLAGLDATQEVDRVVDVIRADQSMNRLRVAELARWLCTFGTARGQVAVGITLLGLYGRERDRHLIARLGLVDPLTLYSVVALRNLLGNPEKAIFDLAVQVEGHGRTYAVEHLADTTNPRIRDWLLRGGYDSGVMVEELAFIAATAGALTTALQGDVDDELLDHAGILLAALANGGPAEDMADYAEGELALELYFGHMMTATASLDRLDSLETVAAYLEEHARTNDRISERARVRLNGMLDEVLARADWKSLVEEAVFGDDAVAFCRVFGLSHRFGIDHRPRAWEWLARGEHSPWIWQELLDDATVVELRELVELATGVSESEPRFDNLLYELRRFPGEGWEVISRSLREGGVRHRSLAVTALAEWNREGWPDGAAELLSFAAAEETDKGLRLRLESLLL